LFRSISEGKVTRSLQVTWQRKDGSSVFSELNIAPFKEKDQTIGVQVIARDITERKNAEEELKGSEEKFRMVAEQSPNMIFINKTGRIVFANRKSEDMMGFTKEDFYSPNFNFLTLIAPESREQIKSSFAKHMRGEEIGPFEYKLLTKQGRTIDAILTTKLITYEGELAILGTVTDITERKKRDEEMRRSEAQTRRLLEFQNKVIDTAIVWIDLLDKEGNVTLWNRAAELISGYSRSEVIGHKKIWEWLYPDRQYCADIFSRAKRTIDSEESPMMNFETVIKCKDGTLKTISWYANNILDENRETTGSIAMGIDVTENKKSESLIMESQQKFEGMFMGNPEATVYTDPKWHILQVNPRFASLFGYSFNEVKGKHLIDALVPKDLIKEAKMLEDKAVGGYVYRDTIRLKKDGYMIPVAVSAAPITVRGRITGYIAVFKDISQGKNAEQRLEIMNEKLRVIGGLTRHDVRNKLSVITGNTYLAKKKLADRPEMMENLRATELACDAILRIFDFARDYEMLGVEELNYVDVGDSIQRSVSLFSNLNGIKVLNECHGLSVLADSLLGQLFYNLIDNSLKYGQKTASIRIHYERVEEEQLRLVYEDDGVGIAAAAKSNLFIEGYSTGKGSGYGLYLVKKMMDVYGWTIKETGEPGKGALFSLTIPKISHSGRESFRLNAQ
jgi:PAS domain S-box-containing protein